jgi:hypothetical protein
MKRQKNAYFGLFIGEFDFLKAKKDKRF